MAQRAWSELGPYQIRLDQGPITMIGGSKSLIGLMPSSDS
jgi:hypothetical protein